MKFSQEMCDLLEKIRHGYKQPQLKAENSE